jgi:hypothetical protein
MYEWTTWFEQQETSAPTDSSAKGKAGSIDGSELDGTPA